MIKKHRNKDRGFYIQWDSTNDCNLSCSHCYHNFGKIKDKSKQSKTMTLEEIVYMLDDLNQTCDRWNFNPIFNISGGECLLRPDLFKIINYSISRGIETRLMTNGTLLDIEKANELKRLGVLSVQISIDGDKETHNRVRGRNWAYNKAMEGIGNCYIAGLHVTVSTTLMKQNASQIKFVVTEAIKNRASGVGFQTLVPNPLLGANDPEFLNCFEIKKAYEEIDKLREIYKGKIQVYTSEILWHLFRNKTNTQSSYQGGCSAGFGGLSVLADGTVYACRRLPISVGHITEGIINLVTKKPLMKELRDNRKKQRTYCSDAPYCGGCRAIAYATTGDYLNKDPTCFKHLI
ncbi:MAG: radical SAM protein [archaeon]